MKFPTRTKAILCMLIAFYGLGFATDYSTWARYRTITVNTTGIVLSGAVANIPIPVRFTAAGQKDLLDSATQMLANGADIRVTKADGVTDLPFEIEQASVGATGALTLWVKADNVAASSAAAFSFRVYWGKAGAVSASNGAAVFDTANGYQAVFHMSDTSANQTDVVRGYLGTATGTATSTASIAGLARTFTNSTSGAADPTVTSNYLSFAPGSTHKLSTYTGPMTLEAWVRSSITNSSNSSPGTKTILSHKSGTTDVAWLKRGGGSGQVYSAGGDTTNANGPAVPGGEANLWHYVVGVWNGTGWEVYRQRTSDGWNSTPAVRTTGGGAPAASTSPWFIGGWSDNGTTGGTITRGWRGQIDEVRISTVARDSNFVKLSFETTKLSPTAISVGATEIPAPPVPGPYASWTGHRTITLNTSATGANVSDMVTNFPVLIRLGSAEASILGAAGTGGASIRFSKADDATPLPYQIESWSSTNAAIWVLMDTIQGNNASQTLRLHYGNNAASSQSNGAAVFDTTSANSGYTAVWHMNAANGNELDATANGFTATAMGTPATKATGAIGSSRLFQDTTQYFEVLNSAAGKLNYPLTGTYTLSAWVYADSITTTNNTGHSIFNKADNQWSLAVYGANTGGVKYYEITTKAGNNQWRETLTNASGDTLKANNGIKTWHHVVGTWNGVAALDTGKIYVDGRLYRTNSFNNTSTSGRNETFNVFIGTLVNAGTGPSGSTYQRRWVGSLDEIVAAPVVRDSNWIRLSYQNQMASNTLADIGIPVITVPGQPTTVTAVAGDAQATVTWAAPLDDGGSAITGYKAYAVSDTTKSCTTTTALTCAVTGLANGTFYTFSVRAINAIGSGPASAASNVVTPAVVVGGLYSAWSGHQSIILNTSATGARVMGNVTNFPLLVRLGSTESAILSGANNGASIRFSKTNDTTALPYQIESWSSTAAAIWVKVDTVKGNNATQTIRLHYGNSSATSQSSGSAVFDTTQFLAVWHLNDSTTQVDASGRGNTGNPSTPAPTALAGSLIGGGKTFNGSTNWYQIGTDSLALNVNPNTVSFTASAWVNPNSCDTRIAAFSKYSNSNTIPGRQYALHTANTATNWRFTVGASALNGNGDAEFFADAPDACVPSAWAHIVGTWRTSGTVTADSAVNLNIYVNGVITASGTTAGVTGTSLGLQSNTYIGRISTDERYMNGSLDEITFAKVARDSNWIRLAYESQKAQNALTNIGPVMTVPGAPTNVTASVSPTSPSGTAVVSWSAPASNGGGTITAYAVTGVPGGTCATTGALTCTVTGLTIGTSYTFTVKATNGAGQGVASAASTAVVVPTGLLNNSYMVHANGFARNYTFRLPEGSQNLTDNLSMTVTDVFGRTVWQKTLSPKETQSREISWNGKNSSGKPASAGIYIVKVKVVASGRSSEITRKGMTLTPGK